MASKNWDICNDVEERQLGLQIRIERDVYKQHDFDNSFGFGRSSSSKTIGSCKRCKKVIRDQCSADKIRSFLITRLPILFWLPKYSVRRDLVYDVIAGLTVGVMHIPQGMAYGAMAGLDPVNGLYTSFFPSLIYVIFGTSRHVSIGTFAVISVIMGSVCDRLIRVHDVNATVEHITNGTNVPIHFPAMVTPVELATAVTFFAGIILLGMGIIRLGFLAEFLSDALISGFITGAAVHVFFSQIPSILGVKRPQCGEIGKIVCLVQHVATNLTGTNLATLGVSAICIVAVFVMKEWISPIMKRKMAVPLPTELIAIIIGTATSYLVGFNYRYGVKIVGPMPTGFPAAAFPRMDLVSWIIGDSISIAIVTFSVTVSVGKVFAKKHNYRTDSNQELLALGITQFFCSLFSCFPPSGSLARSALFESTGARTQFAAVIGCGVILVVLLWLGPLFYCLPKCILASIIIVALKGMFIQCRDLKSLLRFAKLDAMIWISSFTAVLCLGVTYGLAVGVALGLLTLILRVQRSSATLLNWIPGTELYTDADYYSEGQSVYGVKIFRFSAPLNFVNAERFRTSLLDLCGVDLDRMRTYLRTCPAFPPSPPGRNLEYSVSAGDNSSAVPICSLEEKTGDECQNPMMRSDDDQIDQNQEESPSASETSTPTSAPGMVSLRSRELDTQAFEYIIVDCSMFGYVDAMGLNILKQVYQEITEVGIRLLFSACHANVLSLFDASDFYKMVPRDCFYVTIHDAVIYATAGNIIGLKKVIL